jgi:phage tail sheath protein FI
LSRIFAREPNNRLQALTVPFIFETTPVNMEGPAIARTLLGQAPRQDERLRLLGILGLPLSDTTTDLSILATLNRDELGDADRRFTITLIGGNDGARPEASEYEGQDDDPKAKSGLKTFEDIADISIVAAPGYSFGYNNGYQADASQIMRHLISHCERMRYRIAVLDAANGQSIMDVRTYRGQVDSQHAALYYPWVRILDPVTEQEINLPPSGFVAGIYARNDVERGVHKAPANEVVRLAIGFEFLLNKAQQDVLNPEGVNCFRFFEGRGYRLWGARTISSDPEWKYVNLRRYFAFLERSIERGTQWVVFEPNSEALWAKVRRTIEDFLFNEWKSGHLMGERANLAYFVKCDRSTMTQNDFDNGRLICLVGVAPIRPAEFVIFRIGQWTADRRG